MKEYIFIHGKNASLSQAELKAVYGEQVKVQTHDFSIVELNEVKQADQDRLGGTVKIAEILHEDPVELMNRESEASKILFGVSQYSGHQRLSDVLMDLKRGLKEVGRGARFLNKNFTNVSSGQLNQTKVLEEGFDLVLCHIKGQSWWGRTLTFQNIDAYSKRDYDKPKRDMKVGMMPPKLAQIMINLSQAEAGSMIYDPFCGLGTTLMEARLMGYQVIGSDINGRMVECSLANLEWLEREFQLQREASSVFLHDAGKSFPAQVTGKNTSVVTEGYLGPPLSRFPNREEQAKIFDSLDAINRSFFSSISQKIENGHRIVMTFPYFRTNREQVFYPEARLNSYASDNGLVIESKPHSLLYERQDQVVGREIVVFRKG